jgi:hypothetical protein
LTGENGNHLGIDQRILAVIVIIIIVVIRRTIDVVVGSIIIIIVVIIIIILQRTPATHCPTPTNTATLVSRDSDEIRQICESVLFLKSSLLRNLL